MHACIFQHLAGSLQQLCNSSDLNTRLSQLATTVNNDVAKHSVCQLRECRLLWLHKVTPVTKIALCIMQLLHAVLFAMLMDELKLLTCLTVQICP